MKITVTFKKHPRADFLCFWYSFKKGPRTLIWYRATKATPKQLREIKKETRQTMKVLFKDLGKYHDENCKICKRA